MKKYLFLSVTGLMAALAARADETVLDQTARTRLNVTIYNENRALIQDERTATLGDGLQNIAFSGVSDQMIPESALLTGDDVAVKEQNFNYDVLSYQTLLSKSVDTTVTLEDTNPATGKVTRRTAKLLAYNGGKPILQIGDKIEASYPGQILFNAIPKNLRAKPTLVVTVAAQKAGTRPLKLSYLSTGLSWQADYVAQISADETHMTLNGYVTLNNRSGVSYENAALSLVAGDVNIVRTPTPRMRQYKTADAAVMENSVMAMGMAPESLGDYHLYTLPGKTDILSQQTKQVALLSAENVRIDKTYEFENVIPFSGEVKNLKPGIFVTFRNEKDNQLGLALPKGTIRLYQNAATGASLFIGENTINHTGNKETVRLYTGQAFDISADAKQTEYTRLGKDAYQATYQMTLRNGSEKPVSVLIIQTFPKSFEILSESVAGVEKTATTRAWTIPLTANAEQTLTYTVRVQND